MSYNALRLRFLATISPSLLALSKSIKFDPSGRRTSMRSSYNLVALKIRLSVVSVLVVELVRSAIVRAFLDSGTDAAEIASGVITVLAADSLR